MITRRSGHKLPLTKTSTPGIMALPSYSYGTAATVYGKNPTDSYYALDTAGGGGTTIPGNLTVEGPLLTLGPDATAQLLVEDLSGLKVKVAAGSGVGTILQSNAAGTTQTPYLEFAAGNLSILDAAGNAQAEFPAAGGLSMTSTISMNNETVQLGTNSSIYHDSAVTATTLTYPQTRYLTMVETTSGTATVVSAQGVNSQSFGTQANNSAAPISVPSATATTIFTIPLSGAPNIQKLWRILVGFSDGATNYECTFVDVGVFWLGTTSPHYVVAATGQLPVGWSLTVPVIGNGAVEFTHTFGAPLDVYVSAIVMGQNV
jgi:hypothetical protein